MFTNFISFSDFRHVVALIKHRKVKNLRVSFGGVSPSPILTVAHAREVCGADDKFGCRACVNVMHAGQER